MGDTRIIIHGMGRLGYAVADLVGNWVVAAVDPKPMEAFEHFEVYQNIEDCMNYGDVIIDCSHGAAVPALVEKAQIPLVICTTGLSGDTLMKISEAAKRVPIFLSANMSLGVNLIAKLAAQSAVALDGAGFDIEIIEAHHNQKLDSPSGTALLLANSINDAMGGKFEYVYDRSGRLEKRGKNELGISAIRGGSIVGEHTIILAGAGEVIEITHRALSRVIFARGAIAAAEFLKDKPAGLYTMDDLLS